MTVNIPRHRGRRAALFVGIAAIIVVIVVFSIALSTRDYPHPYGNVPLNVTTSPTLTLAAEQPYIMAINDLGINPASLEIEA